MFNTRSVITFLLVLLGGTLFYLWYSTWHRNISTNSLNKKLIEENTRQTPNIKLPPKPTPPAQTPSPAKPSPSPNSSPTPQNTSNKPTPTKPIPNNSNTTPKPITPNHTQTPKPKLSKKTIKKLIKKPIRKQALRKISKPIIRRPVRPKISKPTISKPSAIKQIPLKNGGYQVGAFKYFSDAVSKSVELQSQGKKTKIIHQGGWYKVIVY